jgi:type II secretory pathway component GspD/PulD (secretin)
MNRKAAVFPALTAILVITCYLILVAAGEESSTLIFQGATFSANLEEVSLESVFDKILKETGIWFRVPESDLEEKISVRFKNLPVQEGLRRILRTMNYSLLFDQDNKLIGAFVFGRSGAVKQAAYLAELNEELVKAAMQGETAVVSALLDKGADVNAKGKYSGWTPLIVAAKKGDTELVNLLLSHGADVDAKSRGRKRTALMEAVRNRSFESVNALLTAYPDVDAVDWEGYTVLMFAAVSGQDDIVSVLLNYGADVNMKNKAGSSALMMASGYPNVFKKLREVGAQE